MVALLNRAFSNGSGGFTIKSVTYNVSGVASLETGTLKAFASGEFGQDVLVSGSPLTSGSRIGVASSRAEFADSFRTFADAQPFLWTSGDVAQFSFGVAGINSFMGGLDSNNSQLRSSLVFNVYPPGAIDLIDQLRNFSFSSFPDFNTAVVAFNALIAEIDSREITRKFWHLGENRLTSFPIDLGDVVVVDPDIPTQLTFSFNPGGISIGFSGLMLVFKLNDPRQGQGFTSLNDRNQHVLC